MTNLRNIDVTTPSDTEVVIKRSFNAPRPLVFDAFTKPELVKRWLYGPDGWSLPVFEIDLRPGGAYRYVWREEATGNQMGMGGNFVEVDIPNLYSANEVWDEPWYPGQAIVQNAFTEEGGETVVTMSIKYDSKEARDMAIQTGMSDGLGMGYDRLDTLLEGLK